VTRALVVAGAAALVLAGCAGEGDDDRAAQEIPRGGTLRTSLAAGFFGVQDAFDPQRAYSAEAFELFRCCLLRTLLSYNGRPTAEGGAVLRPDLAAAQPEVSGDGRTWTFQLKPGLRYGPPYEDVEIVAADVIRALERELAPATKSAYPFYYDVIEGAREYTAGKAASIAGLEARGPHTLVVRLTKPTGELGARLALPAAAPIPAGAAEGHAEYGPFLAASGPYMIAGSEQREAGTPVSGYRVGRSLTLVRNPSWKRDSDPLRPAYADRIEVDLGGQADDVRRVDAGELDFSFDTSPPPPYWRKRERVHFHAHDGTFAVMMNLAVPPFDDIHVRKAVNLVLDKKRLSEQAGSKPWFVGWQNAKVAHHVVPDSLANNLLVGYEPYTTKGDRGDPPRARRELARSRYDRNGDGRCDARVCRDVVARGFAQGPFPLMARTIADNLAQLGIELDVRLVPPQDIAAAALDPRTQTPLMIINGWSKDFAGPSTFFVPTFYGRGIGRPETNTSFSLVGARPAQLRSWGYSVHAVPSMDGKIEECLAHSGNAAFQCWAEAEQILMETVVPWAPYLTPRAVRTVSKRVARFSFAQATGMPALDQIALKPGSAGSG
jgi:peptide/nickel transport system substrate-binding protein